jgi:type IV pilus assembly protein PilV
MHSHHRPAIPPRKTKPNDQHGIVLLEALIAVVIFIIGILGLIGLQASMVSSSADANYRAIAGYVAQKRIGDIWLTSDPSSMAEQNTDISAMSGLPSGLRTTTRNPGTASCNTADCFVISVFWTPPGGTAQNNTQHNYTIEAHITTPGT